jgi:energy-coupling factor transporter ATP-binding protein EcfA2
MMKLILENIGPIKSAEIELGKVTVLYGPNAAGKTTVARVLEQVIKMLCSGGTEKKYLAVLVNRESRNGRIELVDDNTRYNVELKINDDGKLGVKILRNGETILGEVVLKDGARQIDYKYYDKDLVNTGLFENLGLCSMIWVRHDHARLININSEYEDKPVRLTDLFTPTTLHALVDPQETKEEQLFMEEYDNYVWRVNRSLSNLTQHHVSSTQTLYFTDNQHFYDENHVAEGVKRVALIIASLELARSIRHRRPVVFVESLEDSLHVDYVTALVDAFSTSEVPVIAETHSMHAVMLAYSKKLGYYVLENGRVFTDLKESSLFERERGVVSQLSEIL